MEGIRFVADVTGALTFSIALPTLKRFTDEKIYPYFSEKLEKSKKRSSLCFEDFGQVGYQPRRKIRKRQGYQFGRVS